MSEGIGHRPEGKIARIWRVVRETFGDLVLGPGYDEPVISDQQIEGMINATKRAGKKTGYELVNKTSEDKPKLSE